jgi:hypothetical protein
VWVLTFDYSSFASAFGPAGIFYQYMTVQSQHYPRVEVLMPDGIRTLILSDDSFTVVSDSPVTYLDANGFFVLTFPKDGELTVTVTSGAFTEVQGDLTLYGSDIKVLFTHDFKRITGSQNNISIFCDIVHLPYTRLPSSMFNFITESYNPRQVLRW